MYFGDPIRKIEDVLIFKFVIIHHSKTPFDCPLSVAFDQNSGLNLRVVDHIKWELRIWIPTQRLDLPLKIKRGGVSSSITSNGTRMLTWRTSLSARSKVWGFLWCMGAI